jgi:hypothetical protein
MDMDNGFALITAFASKSRLTDRVVGGFFVSVTRG